MLVATIGHVFYYFKTIRLMAWENLIVRRFYFGFYEYWQWCSDTSGAQTRGGGGSLKVVILQKLSRGVHPHAERKKGYSYNIFFIINHLFLSIKKKKKQIFLFSTC